MPGVRAGAPSGLVVARDEATLRPYVGGVVVPTMGALHEGHAALIRHAVQIARASAPRRQVVVTLFVNPTQFDDPADFERYPRTLERDAALCADAGAHCVFAPPAEVVYPAGEPAPPSHLPAVATAPGLEDAHRMGHFAGVCRVVARLFALTGATSAVFGEKDWQQLQVVRATVREQGLRVEIVGRPTVREPDGLAMSSRNRFLAPADRRRALALVGALRGAARESDPEAAEALMRRTLEGAGLRLDYAVVRDARTLLPTLRRRADAPGRALVAVRVGEGAGAVRLIDNEAW